MAKMNARMKEIFEKQQVVVLATATRNGVPNVVPITAKKILDDETILVSDQFFSKTLANLQENPQASLTIWDNLEGYQIKGSVAVETSGARFEETTQWIEEMGKALNLPLKSKGAVILNITDIYSVSPGPEAGKKVV